MQLPNLIPSKRIFNFLRAQGVEKPQNFGKFRILEEVRPTLEIANFDWLETHELAESTGVAFAGAAGDSITSNLARGASNVPTTEYIWTNKIWLQCTAETTPNWVYLTPVLYSPTVAYPFAGSTYGYLGTNADDSLICAYGNAVLPPGWSVGVQIIPTGNLDVTCTLRMDFRRFTV